MWYMYCQSCSKHIIKYAGDTAVSGFSSTDESAKRRTAYVQQAPHPSGQKHQACWCAPDRESFNLILSASLLTQHSPKKLPLQTSTSILSSSVKAPSRVWWLTHCITIFQRNCKAPEDKSFQQNTSIRSKPSTQDNFPASPNPAALTESLSL